MFKAIDTLLILVIAVCTVVATGVTIHDSNLNKQNPITKDITSTVQKAETWITLQASKAKTTTNSRPKSSPKTASGQTLMNNIFGKNVIIPTLGSIFP